MKDSTRGSSPSPVFFVNSTQEQHDTTQHELWRLRQPPTPRLISFVLHGVATTFVSSKDLCFYHLVTREACQVHLHVIHIDRHLWQREWIGPSMETQTKEIKYQGLCSLYGQPLLVTITIQREGTTRKPILKHHTCFRDKGFRLKSSGRQGERENRFRDSTPGRKSINFGLEASMPTLRVPRVGKCKRRCTWGGALKKL